MNTAGRGQGADPPEVLHYVGGDDDAGGIVTHVLAVSSLGLVISSFGLNSGAKPHRLPRDRVVGFSRVDGESLRPLNLWRARAVARQVREWLGERPRRLFHGHSRAGLAVALWLSAFGESRVVASVHCYSKQRRFYRFAARRLGGRLRWLTPAMKAHYGVCEGSPWDGCIPSCVVRPAPDPIPARNRLARPLVPGVLRLGGAGQRVAWKGWHRVLEALAALPLDLRNRVHFEQVGDPAPTVESRQYAQSLEARTQALGLAATVRWTPSELSIDRLLASVDCLIVPSDAEPQGMVAMEAIVRGVPVIGTDQGGLTDYLEPGMGWLLPMRDNDPALRDRIASLLDPGAFSSVRITPGALESFMAGSVAQAWQALYRSLL